MRAMVILWAMLMLLSCDKSTEAELPEYDSELSVEMYLEEGHRLKCLVTETIPYSSSTINKMLNDAKVMFSDGTRNDTLKRAEIYDYETGRHYNFASTKLFSGDRAKTYTLKVADNLGREITASTSISEEEVKLGNLISKESAETAGKFSVGLSFSDPADQSNYYRVMIGKGINNYQAAHTDFLLSDIAFDGKTYSFSSSPDYEINDTITVRLYSLAKDHYDYLLTAETARAANQNPFMQPARIKTNISGGQGIFTAILYDERKIVIR